MKVKVGPLGYEVVEEAGLHDHDDNNVKRSLHGDINYRDGIIHLEKDQSDDLKSVVLVHELIHGILFNACAEKHDENLIEVIAHGIVAALKDNAHLYTYLIEGPKPNYVSEARTKWQETVETFSREYES